MEFKLFFGIASSILAIVCFIPYIRDILKRKTEPHTYSWLIWTILQTVGVMAQLKEGAGYGAWALGIGAFFCFAIFLLSLKYGTKNISQFDTLCLLASVVPSGLKTFRYYRITTRFFSLSSKLAAADDMHHSGPLFL